MDENNILAELVRFCYEARGGMRVFIFIFAMTGVSVLKYQFVVCIKNQGEAVFSQL